MFRALTAAACLLLVLGTVPPALAADGVIEINMASAAAGGVTPNDTPGLPVTIDSPGSYMLTGNLETDSANVNVIEITSSDVTLDLNGFSITGPSTAGSGSGIQANALRTHITVKNGSIVGMGNGGMRLAGAYCRAENLRVRGNGDDGIQLGIGGVAEGCMASHNGDIGILVSIAGSLLRNVAANNGSSTSFGGGLSVGDNGQAIENVARNNTGDGLIAGRGVTVVSNTLDGNTQAGVRSSDGCLLQGNTARGNDGFGLDMGPETGYVGNVLTDNDSGSVSGGTQIGTNFCGLNTVCP